MKKKLLVCIFLITLSFSVFSQEQRNNFIVFPVRNHTFLWSFPNYWIGDIEFANSIGEAVIFYINGYELHESIALFGIGFGDNAASISIDNFAVRNMNRWINNIKNTYQINYSSEKINWNINRNDNTKIVIYRLFSNDNPMYQYCAIIQSNMPNYIIAYIQLNIDHEINEVFINDFKSFLENVTIVEGSFDATDEFVEELKNLLEGSEIRRGFN
jgi:hypothetical protein